MSSEHLARVWLALSLAGCLLLLSAPPIFAHEVRPAYLELYEEQPGEFAVLWKVPMQGDMRLALEPRFSGKMEASTAVVRTIADASIESWMLRAPELRGQTLTIDGLEATMTDALVRVEYIDGTSWTGRFTPREPTAVIPTSDTGLSVARVYLKLGVEHILLGVDHLMFVLALLIITRGGWLLIKTITAFTIAHSITLALATLGFVHLPQSPVEAAIALSIVFVAAEIVRRDQGLEEIAARAPWFVAFYFGLLHGLGFAGALSEIGLPGGHIPIALFFFNLGVEAGQLAFVGAMLSLMAAARHLHLALPVWAPRVPAYAIGGLAMFWTIQRVAMF